MVEPTAQHVLFGPVAHEHPPSGEGSSVLLKSGHATALPVVLFTNKAVQAPFPETVSVLEQKMKV